MAAKNEKGESKTETAGGPMKRLVLRREKVRELKARTGVKTGQNVSVVSSFSFSTVGDSFKSGSVGGSAPPPTASIFTSSSSFVFSG